MKKTDNSLKQAKQLITKLYSKKTDTGIEFSISTIVEINTLKSLFNFNVTDSHIIKAIRAIPSADKIGIDEFEKLVIIIQQKEINDDKRTEWDIFIPIDLKIPKLKLEILENVYTIINKKEFLDLKEIEFYRHTIFNDFFLEPKFVPTDSKFLKVKSFGRDFYVAWDNINSSFNILRGITNYTLTNGYWSYHTGLQSRSIISHPKLVYGLSSKGSKRYLEFIVNPTTPHKKDFTIIQKKLFSDLINLFKKIPEIDSVYDLLSDSFRIYNYGMDEISVEFSFLRFWQLAERIAFPYTDKGSNENISSRLIFFSKTYFSDILDPYILSLTKKRNNLVHHGIDQISEDDLNFLKILCEKVIHWLISNKYQLKTKRHLEIYLKSKDNRDQDLLANKEVIRFLNKSRKQK